jgi:hypothetical protein
MRNQALIGAAVMAAGGMCPLLRVPILGNWNYIQLDLTMGIAFYVVVAIGLIGAFTQREGLIKFAGWAGIALVLLTLAGVYFKVQSSFGFLHFKKLVSLASGMVKYKWGWFVILAGTLILITVRRAKVRPVTDQPI